MFTARAGWSLPAILSVGLTYQVATLFVRPWPLSANLYRCLLVGGVVAAAMAPAVHAALIPSLLMSAAGVQGLRDEQLGVVSVSTLPKRVVRILGFATAPVFSNWTLVLVPLLGLGINARGITTETHRWSLGSGPPRRPSAPGRFPLLMVVHQSHYFVYAYSLLFLLVRPLDLTPVIASAIFAAGWVTYSLAPNVLGRLPSRPVLLGGHIWVAIATTVMAFATGNPVLLSMTWLGSGFGGGTVFCIKRLAAQHTPEIVEHLDMWENVGHVLGCGIAIVIVSTVNVKYVFVAASLLAMSTAVLGFIATRVSHATSQANDQSSDMASTS